MISRQKALAALAVTGPAILVLVLAVVTFRAIRAEQATTAAVRKTHDTMMTADSLVSRLLDAETAERGYLLTGRESYLEPHRNARQDIGHALDRLGDLTSNSPEQRERVAELTALVNRRLSSIDRQIELRRTVGFDAAVADVLTGAGNALTDSVRGKARSLQLVEAAERGALIDAQTRQAQVTLATIGIGSALAIILALVINTLLARAKADLQERNRRLGSQAAELRASEERYQTLVNGINDGVYLETADGRIVTVNAAARRILGLPESLSGEISIRNLGWRIEREDGTLMPPQEFPGRIAMRTGKPAGPVLAGVVREGHETIWLVGRSRPVTLHDGTPAAVSTFSDITAQRKAELALKESEEKLRQSQKLEAIGGLAGGVAHDFNNLLTAVISFAQFALDEIPEGSRARADIEEILKAADRATALTQQLLAFGRRQMLQPQDLDLSEVVRSTEKLLRRVLEADIDIELKPQANLGVVHADRVQLEQILINLALNARDAMPRGGRLVIETANVDLDEHAIEGFSGATPGKHVLLSVSDTGTGMDVATRGRVFEPFFTTKEKGKGTGLGLASVYGIVKQSGGAIGVYSEPGKGATFRIYLPRVERAAVAPEPARAFVDTRGNETVLLAEDQDAVRTVIARILTSRGYRVLEAANGDEALALAKAHADEVHLLIADMVMPGIGGIELAERLATFRPEIRVLLMSGYSETVAQKQIPPTARFVEKPFTVEHFASAVRSILDERAG